MLTVLLGCMVIFMRADLLRCMHDLQHACMIWYMHAKLQLFHARGHTDRSNSREGGREGIFEYLCIFELTLRYDTGSRKGLLMKNLSWKMYRTNCSMRYFRTRVWAWACFNLQVVRVKEGGVDPGQVEGAEEPGLLLQLQQLLHYHIHLNRYTGRWG